MNTLNFQESISSEIEKKDKRFFLKKVKSLDVESPTKTGATKCCEEESSKFDEECVETRSVKESPKRLFDDFSTFEEAKMSTKPSTPEPKEINKLRRAKWPLRRLKVIYE